MRNSVEPLSLKEEPPNPRCRSLKPYTDRQFLNSWNCGSVLSPKGRAEFKQTLHDFHRAFQYLETTEEQFSATLPFHMLCKMAGCFYWVPTTTVAFSFLENERKMQVWFFWKGVLNSNQEEIIHACLQLSQHAANQHFPLQLYNSIQNTSTQSPSWRQNT